MHWEFKYLELYIYFVRLSILLLQSHMVYNYEVNENMHKCANSLRTKYDSKFLNKTSTDTYIQLLEKFDTMINHLSVKLNS